MISSKTKVSVLKKWLCVILVLVLTALPLSTAAGAVGSTAAKTNYPTVFVAGYAGWGQYDKMNDSFQYWGMCNGNLLKYLNSQGFECYAASVDPVGSAWDRACELYAQLTGTVVDYGQVHSALNKHSRFGTDYSKNPLFTGWGAAKKVNFIAHSFGGATVRLLAELLANGSAQEVNGTAAGSVSGLFTGGKVNWIYSITTLASPHNGTTMTNLSKPVAFLLPKDGDKIVGVSSDSSIAIISYLKNITKLFTNGVGTDTGVYDLSLDGAAKLNTQLSVKSNIYYFSVPTDSSTSVFLSKNRIANPLLTDAVLWPTAAYMGSTTGVTAGGISYDKSWFNNDGIVNTISCTAPKNEPQKDFDANSIKPGIWNIMDTFKGDHLSITGGLMHRVDVNAFYLAQLKLINSL
jgi:triacylglycerol esterase/lipase EstA (alpha/beta hydrolase family)